MKLFWRVLVEVARTAAVAQALYMADTAPIWASFFVINGLRLPMPFCREEDLWAKPTSGGQP